MRRSKTRGQRTLRDLLLTTLLAVTLLASGQLSQTSAQTSTVDPLPSWKDGATKRAIIDFVTRAMRDGDAGFIPPAERIATFDNDGTLWAERPLPSEVLFVLARVRELAERDPSLKQRQPFQAVLESDMTFFRNAETKDIVELFNATHTGITQEQFAAAAKAFFKSQRHPKLNRPYTETVYQPMLELLAYLRANGFQTWICSGGTVDFMRAFALEAYGIPPERIMGSEIKRESRMQDGVRVIWRVPSPLALNDKEVKPVTIDRQIGRRPAFVGGNVGNGGDIAMMEYSKGRAGPSFQLLINHDDAEREFAYVEQDGFSLSAAKKEGFTVVNMKSDWKRIFPDSSTSAGTATSGANVALEGTYWKLIELSGKPINQPAGTRWRYVRLLAANKRLEAFGGVNQLTSDYQLDGELLSFSRLVSTRRAGPPQTMKEEANFALVLGATTGYHLSGQTLELLSGARVVARFQAENQ